GRGGRRSLASPPSAVVVDAVDEFGGDQDGQVDEADGGGEGGEGDQGGRAPQQQVGRGHAACPPLVGQGTWLRRRTWAAGRFSRLPLRCTSPASRSHHASTWLSSPGSRPVRLYNASAIAVLSALPRPVANAFRVAGEMSA